MRRLLALLGGAVVAAAFLGPGTVTTAARAGGAHRYALLWALLFATVACLVLQEASARLTIASGSNLGEALRRRFRRGAGGAALRWLALAAIVVGCAAYEAGNILGGVEGGALATGLSRPWLTLLSGVAAGLLLWLGSTRIVVAVLAGLVALMGFAFLITALLLRPPAGEVALGALVPTIPAGGGLLVLGLVGTTVVPYNLFLGSGLARGHGLSEARLGLVLAIGLGGLISMGVLVVGAAAPGAAAGGAPFYPALAAVLAESLGPWARPFFASGLFAAGFSSAVTAPLAAAITARSLLADGADDPRWSDTGLRYRAVWLGVLATGVACGLTGIRPVPAILAAQALNGLLLPIAALLLWAMMNDRRLLGDAVNGPFANGLTAAVVAVTVALGARGLLAAAAGVSGVAALASPAAIWGTTGAALVAVGVGVARARRKA